MPNGANTLAYYSLSYYERLSPASTVAEHLTHKPKTEDSNPAICTGREYGQKRFMKLGAKGLCRFPFCKASSASPSCLDTRVFPGMVRPIEYAPIRLSFEEVAVRAGHEVLIEVDDKISPIGGAPKGILDQQLKPPLIQYYHILSSIVRTFIHLK